MADYGFNLNGKNMYFLGAHDGLEYDILEHLNVNQVFWVECNQNVIPDLYERVGHNPRHSVGEACLWSVSGLEKYYHFYRNEKDGAGGLFKPDLMTKFVPDCPILENKEVILTTITLDDLVEEKDVFLDPYLAVIDVQGAELELFKGAQKMLTSESLEWMYCEVSWDHVYKDGPLMKDIDDYLKQYGFHRYGLRQDWAIHGDAIYKRKR
jgi:FkbM family methyltransferase